jgi:DNA-binding NarL/FixJ family response regulator
MMKEPAMLTVLSVSPLEEDHVSLRGIFDHSIWKLLSADRVPAALALLRQHEISVILCERDLMPGTWIDMLENIKFLSHPPALIVTSRLADDRFWSEVMSVGAWDVLPKPFERTEIIRTIKSGWQHWYDQTRIPAKAAQVMTAAS